MLVKGEYHTRAKGDGKRIRRARNIVRRYSALKNPSFKLKRRYERANALLVHEALVESK